MPSRKDREPRKKVMTPKQVRARARRNGVQGLDAEERTVLMGKPLDQWDMEELARGRPRDKNGAFAGVRPKWVSQQIHEAAIDRFKEAVRTDMRSVTIKSLEVLESILDDDGIDDKGKPTTPPAVKVDVAKFLLEHLVGKPKQEIQNDISVKLQGILGAVLVQPDGQGGMVPASSHRVLELDTQDEADDDDE